MKEINKARKVRSPKGPEPGQKRSSISYTKNNLSALIDRVRHGESITIVDRDQPVARLVPVTGRSQEDLTENLAALERAGLIKRGAIEPVALAKGWEPVRSTAGGDILAALLADRNEDLM